MIPSAVSLTTILAIVALGSTIGFLAGVRRKMDLEQWTVGGRGFGAVLMYLLMAGEVYTMFSFLGASAWAYSRGGPALYIMAYLTLAYVVSLQFTCRSSRSCGPVIPTQRLSPRSFKTFR